MRRAALILLTLLLTQLPALADRDEKTFTKLMGVASGAIDISNARGGKDGKPLGFYFDKANVVFRSGYEKQPARTMAEFAYDLNEFIHTKGGGYDNFYSYTKELEQSRQETDQDEIKKARAQGKLEPEILAMRARQLVSHKKEDSAGLNPYNPWIRAHVSYDQQKDFAGKWWQDNKVYDDAMMKDWWLNDAILDCDFSR